MKKSFTLVELLVVISIMGLMAAVIVVGVQQARAKGRDAKRVADINLLAQKIQAYYSDPTNPNNHSFPSDLSTAGLDFIPQDPDGSNYIYQCTNHRVAGDLTTECIQYLAKACLENAGGSNGDDSGKAYYKVKNSATGAMSTVPEVPETTCL